MTNIEKAVKKAVKNWCKENNIKVTSVSHIYPRAYVLCKAASSCLYVSKPLIDAEPRIVEIQKVMNSDNGDSVRLFDESLITGSWCSVAYVTTACGSGQPVAVQAVTFK